MELLEFRDPVGLEKIDARRDTCPSLQRRAELFEREPHALRRFETNGLGSRAKFSICPACSRTLTIPMRLTRSPRPCRIRTELMSCRRGRSRMTPIVSRSISLSWAVCLAALGPPCVRSAQCAPRPASAMRRRHPKVCIREVREARAEFARQFQARTGVDRENREAMRKFMSRRELLPVSVPVCVRFAKSPRSSGCTRPPAASATFVTVVMKSSSSFFRLASAALRSVSKSSAPSTRAVSSAEAPASADLGLVHSFEAFGQRLPHVGRILRADGHARGGRGRHLGRIAVEATALQRSERQIMDAAADVHALAHKLFSGLLETLFDRSC